MNVSNVYGLTLRGVQRHARGWFQQRSVAKMAEGAAVVRAVAVENAGRRGGHDDREQRGNCEGRGDANGEAPE